VPLPYLLYRVNARFQEDIRGLRDIQGALNPTSNQSQKAQEFPEKPQTLASRMIGGDPMSASRLGSPLGVRARLNSLGTHSPKPKHAVSSSTLTLQATARKAFAPMEPPSPSTEESESDSDDSEVDRKAEADEVLTRKLADLQKMMTVDTIGLVTGNRLRGKGKARDRGRSAPLSPRSVGSLSSRVDTLSSRSQSVSSASSPQGSIPEITSTSGDSQPHSPMGKNLSHKSSSPPALSSRNALSHAHHRRYDRMSDFGGSLGSGVSSLSDLSGKSIDNNSFFFVASFVNPSSFPGRCEFICICLGQ